MSKDKNCPICGKHYYEVSRSSFVCNFHQEGNWKVTVCKNCHRGCFSPIVGLCLNCKDKKGL